MFIRSLSLGMSLLISAERDFCYFLCGAFKIVLQKGLTVDLKVSVLAFGKSGQEKQQQLLALGSILGGSQVYLVAEQLRALSNVWHYLGLTSFLCSAMLAAQMEKTSWAKEGARQGRLGRRLAGRPWCRHR